MTTPEILALFTQVTTDLLWSSESDYPFEIVTWERGEDLDPTALFNKLAKSNDAIETITLADFFAPALKVEGWYESDELALVNRYTDLFHAIESNLSDVKVFRVGEVEIAIYIIGKTFSGDIIGLRTDVVET
ncbi:nuclease A inhibitor family protein [Chamaesiphon sp. VAR_48_metabat_403]|uniref:nuclease A inhibitor family protein n=1 Tax=Chamaesiphon sp. VAR_48_metabat_403 TaxID=2964700 RepID=UPI00286DDC38|nr:nuclease A inhibitor family protein [Chamaesiphon sp. VAR_48_metabat_403]